MDEDFKWPAIMFCGIALAGALAACWSSYAKSLDNRVAMEHGYVQTVDADSGKVLWVKDSSR